MRDVGRLLLILGVALAAAGAVLLISDRIPWLGRLPGDFVFRKGGATIAVPIVTCVVLSILLTLLLNLFFRR